MIHKYTTIPNLVLPRNEEQGTEQGVEMFSTHPQNTGQNIQQPSLLDVKSYKFYYNFIFNLSQQLPQMNVNCKYD